MIPYFTANQGKALEQRVEAVEQGGGGTTVEASTQLVEGASTANSLKIGDTDWNLPQGGSGSGLPVIDAGDVDYIGAQSGWMKQFEGELAETLAQLITENNIFAVRFNLKIDGASVLSGSAIMNIAHSDGIDMAFNLITFGSTQYSFMLSGEEGQAGIFVQQV